MALPVVIGKSSANEPFIIDLAKLPHLFVAYTEESQVHELFALIFNDLSMNNATIEIAIGLSNSGTPPYYFNTPNILVKHCFIPEEDNDSTEKNNEGLIVTLSKEMKQRRNSFNKRQLKKVSSLSISRPIIIVLHDVFRFIVSKKKSIGLIFLELLLKGPELNMHLIALSSGTYHNLLKQLVLLNPLVQERFQLGNGNDGLPINASLGAELVITGEDFFFFKKAGATDYQRLYPPYEKKLKKECLIQEEVQLKPLQLVYT